MEYSVTHFVIKASDDMMQICRDLLSDCLSQGEYESFVETPDGLDAYIQTQYYTSLHVQSLIDDFPIEDVEITFTSEEVESQNWNETWEQEIFEPIRVNEKCIIYDAKSPDCEQLAAEAPISVGIHQQMAFGTGAHETTHMIVEQLVNQDLNGKRVLDCGCGTGILSIVSKRCGASHVTAYDIDEWSVDNTHHNAEINGVELLDVLLGDVSVLSHVDGMFDIIVANINRNILLADLPVISETLAIDGRIILSGFYEDDIPMLLEKANELGLDEDMHKVRNNWAMLVLKRQ